MQNIQFRLFPMPYYGLGYSVETWRKISLKAYNKKDSRKCIRRLIYLSALLPYLKYGGREPHGWNFPQGWNFDPKKFPGKWFFFSPSIPVHREISSQPSPILSPRFKLLDGVAVGWSCDCATPRENRVPNARTAHIFISRTRCFSYFGRVI